jgi:hypothetical protein
VPPTRPNLTLQTWDPHSGTMTPLECAHTTEKGRQVTRVHLVLEPVKSVFLTEPFEADAGGVREKK